MHEYKTARSIFSFAEFCAWALVVVGIILALVGMAGGGRMLGSSAGFIGALPGLVISIFGVFMAMNVQIGRAAVDSARNSSLSLKIAEEQLRLAKGSKSLASAPVAQNRLSLDSTENRGAPVEQSEKEAPATGEGTSQSVSTTAKPAPPSEPKITTYEGLQIKEAGMGVSVNGQWFKSEDEARAKIDVGEVPMIGKRS